MKKAIMAAVVAVALAGCGAESEFLGTWKSAETGAQYQLQKDGDCRYTNGEGLGTICEWSAQDERSVTITVSKERNFVDMKGKLVGGELMVSNPAGVDFFKRQ